MIGPIGRIDYTVEADSKLLDSCNYRYGYCFWTPKSLASKIGGLPGADRWAVHPAERNRK